MSTISKITSTVVSTAGPISMIYFFFVDQNTQVEIAAFGWMILGSLLWNERTVHYER